MATPSRASVGCLKGYVLPSKLAVNSVRLVSPWAFVRSVVYLIPLEPLDSIRLSCVGDAGPRKALLLAGLVFQVPTNGSCCACSVMEPRAIAKISRQKRIGIQFPLLRDR